MFWGTYKAKTLTTETYALSAFRLPQRNKSNYLTIIYWIPSSKGSTSIYKLMIRYFWAPKKWRKLKRIVWVWVINSDLLLFLRKRRLLIDIKMMCLVSGWPCCNVRRWDQWRRSVMITRPIKLNGKKFKNNYLKPRENMEGICRLYWNICYYWTGRGELLGRIY